MAVGVIGGVLLSTALTLYVVPCVYTFFAWFDRRWEREPKRAPARRTVSAGHAANDNRHGRRPAVSAA
jgi:hypothetical protein